MPFMPEYTLDHYIELFQNLNVNEANTKKSGFSAPHQPILVLSLIQAFERGLFKDESIYLTPELVDIFMTNWSLLEISGNYHPTIALPFYHISSKINRKEVRWWRLIPHPGYEMLLESKVPIRSFRGLMNAVDHAEIELNLAIILSIKQNRDVLRQAVLRRYFPNSINADLRSAGDRFDQISDEIANEAPAVYEKNMLNLKERMSIDDKQRELFQQEIYVRGGVFKRDVPKYYKYTCSISRLKVNATITVSMIDACHIKPFSKSNNDTITNGIALCPNLHRAFDRGLIAIDDSCKVMVSNRFSEGSESEGSESIYSIRQLSGIQIVLPDEPRFRPLPENFAWHRKHIFNS